MPFGEEIIGKKLMYQNRSWEIEILPKLSEFWNDLWLGKGRRR